MTVGMRRVGHLPARPAEGPLQGVRRGEHLRAQAEKERVQGVRRGEHLRAHADKEHVQEVPSRQGRFDAAGPGGALRRAVKGPRLRFPIQPEHLLLLRKERLGSPWPQSGSR